jgi:hypothetical protein
MYYSSMISEQFGIIDETQRPADPWQRLKVFGGTLTIEEYRTNFSKSRVIRLERPRFCMERIPMIEIADDYYKGVSVGGTEAVDEPSRIAAITKQLIDEERSDPSCALFTAGTTQGKAVATNELSLFDQFANALQENNNNAATAHATVMRNSKEVSKIGAGGKRSASAAAAARATVFAASRSKNKRNSEGLLQEKKSTKKKQTGKSHNL